MHRCLAPSASAAAGKRIKLASLFLEQGQARNKLQHHVRWHPGPGQASLMPKVEDLRTIVDSPSLVGGAMDARCREELREVEFADASLTQAAQPLRRPRLGLAPRPHVIIAWKAS